MQAHQTSTDGQDVIDILNQPGTLTENDALPKDAQEVFNLANMPVDKANTNHGHQGADGQQVVDILNQADNIHEQGTWQQFASIAQVPAFPSWGWADSI